MCKRSVGYGFDSQWGRPWKQTCILPPPSPLLAALEKSTKWHLLYPWAHLLLTKRNHCLYFPFIVCVTQRARTWETNDECGVFTWEFLLDSQCASKTFMIYLMSSALLYTSLPTQAFIFQMHVVIRTIPGPFIWYIWQVPNTMKN